MTSKVTTSVLTSEQAEKLLAPIGHVSIVDIGVVATTNDVYKITTSAHGNYYVKFHTARWYADQPDTFFVVERECAACDLLQKRGMSLPYRAWGDFTRIVVPRSVFICGELPGIPVPEAATRFPNERDKIVQALGQYMRQLHDIKFSRAGLLAAAHAYFASKNDPIPPVFTWDKHPMHHAEYLQHDALDILERKTNGLAPPVVLHLRERFQSLADTVKDDYEPPRFTVGNCHAWHFHVDKANGSWKIQGFFDFEAVSAGDSNIDLAELEITLTPALGTTSWRDAFFDGYGAWPSFEGYKRRLLYYLLFEIDNPNSKMIPDKNWLDQQWIKLINVTDWTAFNWYPETQE